ncbi:uncharacterized protein RHOBADRAFT_51754 [Rhodotorula graminis WP1]|uniref:BTB domain-containing protein n=1 Tax=Rhodotorula graminis (strain WP1) TaxID=578459 RepID=A0A194S7Q1_RHOGW|nr:uncharacterized protein RHOBADRAFT_51754 [Rhodotorula graminis WP1]KPV76758.1 hypothetical protein RHOBADRAFT_51754 [Rhodotorula graminis WP1]
MASAASAARAVAAPSLDTSEFLETRSVQLEWKVSNLRQLFDQTKGDTKSKCIKSALFDQSRWQIFLYPNSGNDQYLSIYLSCEPTVAEKERALAEQPSLSANDGAHAHPGGKEKERVPWRRDGKYLFTFEVRSVDRRVTFKQLESEKPHTFWYRERNWGYASYLTRNAAFYNNPNTRAADALLIVCTIVSAPTLPSNPPLPHLLVPKTLIHAYASLFDDPDYSDVVFRIRPDRLDGGSGPRRREKRLYAAKKVLAGRSEYFDTMFSSAFSEATLTRPSTSRRDSRPTPTTTSTAPHPLRSSDRLLDAPSESDEDDLDESDDGCDEDDDSGIDESDEDDPSLDDDRAASTHEGSSPAARSLGATVALSTPPRPPPAQLAAASSSAAPAPLVNAHPAASPRRPEAPRRSRTSSMEEPSDDERSPPPPAASGDGTSSAQDPGAARGDGDEDDGEEDDDDEEEDEEPHDRPSTPRGGTSRFVDAPTSAPASPARAMRVEPRKAARQSTRGARGDDRPRFEVVVTDAAYSTFRALLHFLYTDSISFSPLASTYYIAKDHASSSGLPFPYASRRAFLAAQAPSPSPSLAVDGHAGGAGSVKSAQVGPASAKAIYRLADKMGLVELKERAYDHVVSSLTAQNIVYEVFGSFSSRFDEIRRVEVNFLLEKWNEVRAGPQMRKVFEYLRSPSRFPGFEDVWLDLVQNLEVRVPPPAALSPAGAGADTASHGACGSGRGGEGGEQSQGEGGRS